LDARCLQFIFRRRTSAQSKNFVPKADEFGSEWQSDVAAADNQNAHDIFYLRYAIYNLRAAQNFSDRVNRIS
jgi:hypothetical protein